mmetsp:Transcript_21863/g.21593  ORF Transcript_21863/g.21593 Transcript_21863/m.21593 type:complete len:81 (+) Transcript_21863:169-411(+)
MITYTGLVYRGAVRKEPTLGIEVFAALSLRNHSLVKKGRDLRPGRDSVAIKLRVMSALIEKEHTRGLQPEGLEYTTLDIN